MTTKDIKELKQHIARYQMHTLYELVEKGEDLGEIIEQAPYLSQSEVVKNIAIDPKKYGHFEGLLK